MPAIISKQLNESTQLIVWDIKEPVSALNKLVEHVTDEQTLTPKHNLHWLASRAAIVGYFKAPIKITKDMFNKPALWVNGKFYHLSISHSFNMAVVIISMNHAVAVDIEKIDERVVRVSSKFINDAEQEMMLEVEDKVLHLTLTWSAKETLYKFHGLKELDFKKHLTVFTKTDYLHNAKTNLRGCLHKTQPVFYDMHWERVEENYVLTYMHS